MFDRRSLPLVLLAAALVSCSAPGPTDSKGATQSQPHDATKSLQNKDEQVAQSTPPGSPEREAVEALLAEGEAYLRDGDYQAAIATFTEALAIDPNYPKALGNRGVARARIEDYIGALDDYDRAIALDPDLSQVHYNRGLVHLNLEKYEAAIADFDAALALEPDFAQAVGNRGFARAELEDYTGAIADLQEASELFRAAGNDEAYYRLQYELKYLKP